MFVDIVLFGFVNCRQTCFVILKQDQTDETITRNQETKWLSACDLDFVEITFHSRRLRGSIFLKETPFETRFPEKLWVGGQSN
jgi:hypothetical protein